MKMRKIKFRAWDEENKKMWYWGPQDIHSEAFWVGVRVHGHKLMQYTGKKDKCGKEIYEQDTVKKTSEHRGRTHIGEVYWDSEFLNFNVEGCYFPYYDNPGDFFSEETDRVEVIGNQWENPELLEEVK